jgi:hypothetical protein
LGSEVANDESAGVGEWATRAVEFLDGATPAQAEGILAAGAWSAFHRGDSATAVVLASRAIGDGAPTGCPFPYLAYFALGTASLVQGHIEESARVLRQGLSALESDGAEPSNAVYLQVVLSAQLLVVGDGPAARALSVDTLRIARQSANPSRLCHALYMYGWTHWTSEPAAALDALEESAALLRDGAGGSLGHVLGLVAHLRTQQSARTSGLLALREAVTHASDVVYVSALLAALDFGVRVFESAECFEAATVLDGFLTGDLGSSGGLPRHQFPGWNPVLQRLQDGLGSRGFESAMAKGRAMSFAHIVAFTLGELDQLLVMP